MAGDFVTCWCVVTAAERETRMCGHVGYLMPGIFPPVGRSGRDNSIGGVAGRKQCHQKFFPTTEVI